MKGVLLFLGLLIMQFSYAQKDNLDYFIDQASANSPLLKDYQNQIQSSFYDSLQIRALYKPQVTGTSYNDYAPIINGYGYDQIITNGGVFSALVGVNKQLSNKRTIDAEIKNLQLANLASTNSAKLSTQDLKKTIVTQYITAYGDLLELKFNNQIDTLLSKEDVILKKLTQKNVYRQVDYLTFLVTLQQQNLTTRQLAIQYQNDYAMLNYLSGISDTSIYELKKPDINIQQSTTLTNSFVLRQFEIDSLKLANNKALIDINYRPKINLFADAGYNSSLAYNAYKNFGASFGISAVIPIYDGKQRRIQYNKIAIEEQTRENYKTYFTKQYTQQTLQLNQQLNNLQELLDEIEAQLKYSESLITTNVKLLETGDVRISDYILSLNGYLNVKNLITQNNINQLQLINQINYRNR
jgi:uncharacterized protein YukE